MTRLLVPATLLLLTGLAPTALAHARAHVDVDLDVDAGLEVVARARARHDARLSYEWDWGDGGVSFGAEARHAYERPGRYEVRVEVTDEDTGRRWTERALVRVEGEADARAEEAEEAERDARRARRAEAGASARVSPSGLDARAGIVLGGARDAGADDDLPEQERAADRMRAQSHARHEVPAPGAALLAPALGALALALRRRNEKA